MAGERKAAYIVELLRDAQALVKVIDKLADQENEYFDNAYGTGGAAEILNADVAKHDITAANITGYITLIQQLQNFANGAAVTAGDYAATLNALRRAPGV